MKHVLLASLSLASLLVIGCSRNPSIEGDWVVTGLRAGPVPVGTTVNPAMNFKNPAATLRISGQADAMGQKVDMSFTAPASYAIEGDHLKLNFTDFRLDSTNHAAMTVFNTGIGKAKTLFTQTLNSNVSGKMIWRGKNKFTVEAPSGRIVFERGVEK